MNQHYPYHAWQYPTYSRWQSQVGQIAYTDPREEARLRAATRSASAIGLVVGALAGLLIGRYLP